jgi:Protein-tyrosine phosphatase
VLLVRFVDQIKCDQYWPNRGTYTYGALHVTLIDSAELATYTIRTFLVSRVSILCNVEALVS